jgi:hypothetical protein
VLLVGLFVLVGVPWLLRIPAARLARRRERAELELAGQA